MLPFSLFAEHGPIAFEFKGHSPQVSRLVEAGAGTGAGAGAGAGARDGPGAGAGAADGALEGGEDPARACVTGVGAGAAFAEASAGFAAEDNVRTGLSWAGDSPEESESSLLGPAPSCPHRQTSPDGVLPQVSLWARSFATHRSQSADGIHPAGALAGASQAGSLESSLPLAKTCPSGQSPDTAPCTQSKGVRHRTGWERLVARHSVFKM